MIKSVVIVEPVGGEGGMDFMNHQLSQSIGKKGWSVGLCSSSSQSYSSTYYDSYDVFNGVFGSESILTRGMRYFLGLFRTCRLIILRDASIVHFHFFRVGLKETFMVGLVKLLGRKVVISAHDVGSFRNNDDFEYGLRYVYTRASAIICHSKLSSKALNDLNCSLEGKISLVPLTNYINYLPVPQQDYLKKLRDEDNQELRILLFGKLKRIKRVDLAIKAIGTLKRKGVSSVKLIIAGKPYDITDHEIAKAIFDEGVDDSVTFISKHISDEELSSLLAWANISVLPYDEIFQSGVLLLCMSNRVPVVVSNIAGMVEVVSDGLNGSTFLAGDALDLAEKLEKLRKNPDVLQDLANNAFDYVQSNHSSSLCGNLYVEAYSRTLNGDGDDCR